ncbi:MAG: SsrA-binding protein SmpB [Clostridia bacterium]|nr:SsrA-binding protein SmpB [Clostridia bacterium]
MNKKNDGKKLISSNKKAYHDYFVEEKFEAGIVLQGTEVKSVRNGNVNLKDSYCRIEKGEIFVLGMHISPYEQGNIFNCDPLRPKKLLMHKKEILKLFGKVGKDGLSIIPLSVYISGSHIKVELGLCKGKKLYDKREALAQKQLKRETDRFMKNNRE